MIFWSSLFPVQFNSFFTKSFVIVLRAENFEPGTVIWSSKQKNLSDCQSIGDLALLSTKSVKSVRQAPTLICQAWNRFLSFCHLFGPSSVLVVTCKSTRFLLFWMQRSYWFYLQVQHSYRSYIPVAGFCFFNEFLKALGEYCIVINLPRLAALDSILLTKDKQL